MAMSMGAWLVGRCLGALSWALFSGLSLGVVLGHCSLGFVLWASLDVVLGHCLGALSWARHVDVLLRTVMERSRGYGRRPVVMKRKSNGRTYTASGVVCEWRVCK